MQPLGEGAVCLPLLPDAAIWSSLQLSCARGGVCVGLRELGILGLGIGLPSCVSLQAEVEAYSWDTC